MGANMKDIKRRIKSVESTGQITKAMELVATSKLKKAKESAEKSRPYFNTLYEVMYQIASSNTDFSSIYTQDRKSNKKLFVVIAGDRGLAGGYNINLLKTADALIDSESSIIGIGKKAVDYYEKSDNKVVGRYGDIESRLNINAVKEIGNLVIEMYKNKEIDEVHIVFTQFVSSLVQTPIYLKVLPLKIGTKKTTPTEVVEYEPTPEELFDTIVPNYVNGMIYGAMVEAFASEQGARRTAMESASDNAKEMIDTLSLSYNRARQAAITQEISEIVSGANASEQ